MGVKDHQFEYNNGSEDEYEAQAPQFTGAVAKATKWLKTQQRNYGMDVETDSEEELQQAEEEEPLPQHLQEKVKKQRKKAKAQITGKKFKEAEIQEEEIPIGVTPKPGGIKKPRKSSKKEAAAAEQAALTESKQAAKKSKAEAIEQQQFLKWKAQQAEKEAKKVAKKQSKTAPEVLKAPVVAAEKVKPAKKRKASTQREEVQEAPQKKAEAAPTGETIAAEVWCGKCQESIFLPNATLRLTVPKNVDPRTGQLPSPRRMACGTCPKCGSKMAMYYSDKKKKETKE